MQYFANYDTDGRLLAFGEVTDNVRVLNPISREEYLAIVEQFNGDNTENTNNETI